MRTNGHTRPAHQNDKKFVGKLVRNARLNRDLSVKEAAALVGVYPSAWYRWEAGRVSDVTTRLVLWLIKDHTRSHDAFYWRERAMLAEQTLEAISRKVVNYEKDKEDFSV